MDESAMLALLEAIYALELDDAAWLNQALAAIKALSGAEHSYLAYFYDASDMNAFTVWNVCADQPPEVSEAFHASQTKVSPELLMATLRSVRVGSVRRTGMPHVGPLFAERSRVGWGDIFSVNGLDPSGVGCLVTIGTRDFEFLPPKKELAVYTRIADHLAAAFRCRRRLGLVKMPHERTEPPRAVAEAILDAEGHFVHAQGEAASKAARERIHSAAQTISSLRKGRRSGHATLDAWRPLINARWTLVDSFEESGRRYVLARENQAQAGHLDALTDREREVVLQALLGLSNKEIAYALGLSDSTVRVLMSRAAARFGVRTRAELLAHPSVRAGQAEEFAKRP